MHCITFTFSQYFMYYRCVFICWNLCAVRIRLGWTHDAIFFARHMLMHTYLFISFFLVLGYDGAFLFVSLSLSLSNSLHMAPKHKFALSWNPIRSRASSSDPTPLHVRFHDEKAQKDFLENFTKRGVHSKRRMILSDFFDTTLPTVIYNRGWESLCEIPVSCSTVIIQEFYSNMHDFNTSIPRVVTQVRGTRIVATLELISDVLHVPKVLHPDYPSCPRLRTVSKDELLSLFCETLSSWGDRQNTSCLGFTKGPRFLNIVMTFVLHSLFSICSPFVITRIIRYSSIPYPEPSLFTIVGAISAASVQRSEA